MQMSGRGKGGKGLGSNPKRAKVAEYEWKDNESIYVISYCNNGDNENLIYYVPVGEVDPVLAHVVTNMDKESLCWDLGEVESFDDFFENITAKEYAKINREEEGEEEGDENEDDDDDEEEEIEDKEEVIDSLREWINGLSKRFHKRPTVAVKIVASVGFTESC